MSTLDALELADEEIAAWLIEQEIEKAESLPVGADLQPGIISLFLNPVTRKLLPPTALLPDLYSDPVCTMVIIAIGQLQADYPEWTKEMLRNELGKMLTADDPYEVVFALLDRDPPPSESPYILRHFDEWAGREHRRKCTLRIAAAVDAQQYDKLEPLIDDLRRGPAGSTEVEPFGFVNAAEFRERQFDKEFYVEDILQARLPCLVGGDVKVLKTGILCDLTISLATGQRFLGHFNVPAPRRVAFFSAESGQEEIHARINTIEKVKGQSSNYWLSFVAPKLADADDLAKISSFVRRHAIDVVIVDPLYLTLLTGGDEISASNMFQMGPLLLAVSDACLRAGATPILCHHTTKGAKGLGLNAMAFSGASQFARQSIMIGRQGEYTSPNDNRLTLRTHGQARGVEYGVHIDETRWTITIVEGPVGRTATGRTGRPSGDSWADELAEALSTMDDLGNRATKEQIRNALGWNSEKINRALLAGQTQHPPLFASEKQGRNTYWSRV